MKNILMILLLGTSVWGYGDGTLYWTPHACDEGKAAAARHGGHGKGESAMFALMNLDTNATARLVAPDLSSKPLTFKAHTVMLPESKAGGYYALVAEANGSEGVFSAIRYLSLHGRPSGVSPTKLTALSKTTLEIVPDPLHREHDRYTASKSYRFVARFRGKPLPNALVTLETHNTPAHVYRADGEGKVEIPLPNDFKGVKTGRSENRPSEFLLTLSHAEGGLNHTTTFSMPYSLNPNDFWQSQEWGAGAILLGFLGGMLLYRRSHQGANHG